MEENAKKKREVRELRFAVGMGNEIIFLECYSDGTSNPDAPPTFTRFSSCKKYVAEHYKGAKIKAVYTGMPDYEKKELEGIINSEG